MFEGYQLIPKFHGVIRTDGSRAHRVFLVIQWRTLPDGREAFLFRWTRRDGVSYEQLNQMIMDRLWVWNDRQFEGESVHRYVQIGKFRHHLDQMLVLIALGSKEYGYRVTGMPRDMENEDD